MDKPTSAPRKLADSGRRGHVEDLLGKYPDIPAAEIAEILRFLKKGPPLEVALMTADDRVGPKLRAFRRDHAAEFSLGTKEYLAVALVVLALVAILALLWDSGLGR